MQHIGTLILLVLSLAAFPCMAHVQLASTSKEVHLRAGPARGYPVVARLPAGFEVAVQGCLRDYSWCDVIAGPDRGWVYAGNIKVPYRGVDVPVLKYGAEIGIAVIGFILLDYWAFHYPDRPYYQEREWWVQRPRPPRIIGPPPIPRPQPPRQDTPGAKPPAPPQPDAPEKRRPQPPQPGSPRS